MGNCSVKRQFKQKLFYNVELLSGEMEENGILVLNILIHPLSYAILYSLLIKTKSIPLIYHKNCIRYSIFEHNA
jgi:hypothetical protein